MAATRALSVILAAAAAAAAAETCPNLWTQANVAQTHFHTTMFICLLWDI